jgi:hypothetical protein
MKIFSSIALLMVLAFASLLSVVFTSADSGPLHLSVPAASMKSRADLERMDFVANYLTPKRNYPLAKIFQAALLFPTDSSVGAQILARGGGVLTCAIVGPEHATFTNTGSSTVRLPLKALLENQNVSILVEIPTTVTLDVIWDDTNNVTVKSMTPIQVTFINQPAPGGVPIGIASVQQVDSLSISSTDLVLQSHAVNGGMGLQLDMQLNVAQPAASTRFPENLVGYRQSNEIINSLVSGVLQNAN